MKTSTKHWAGAALAAALSFSLPPPAVAAVNLTDIWWNPAESGWAVYVSHQGETAGFGFLHYDAAGNPFFVTAGLRTIALTNPGALPVMEGTLIATTGPAHNGAFDPGQVTRQPVGTVSFEPLSANEARLHYTLNGQAQIKTLVRMTVESRNLTGVYRHVQRMDFLSSSPEQPARSYDSGRLVVEQNGNVVSLNFQGGDRECLYTGLYAQSGRYGSITGQYACSTGVGGNFSLTEVEVTPSGLSGKWSSQQGMPGFQRGSFSAVAQ